VDKTAYVHRLVTRGKLYFLSRPRRFGKSLLISTLEALFQGRRGLFEDLHIADKWGFEPHPVIRLDFLDRKNDTEHTLSKGINRRLDEIAEAHDLRLAAQDSNERFRSSTGGDSR